MRMPLSVASFGLVLYAGLVTAQTAQQPQTPPVRTSAPATRSDTPSKSESPGTAMPSATGGVAGSASSSSVIPESQIPETQIPETQILETQILETQAPGNSISAMADSDLERQIQIALSKEPTLSGDSAHVTITGDIVELAGTVGTSKEKITATRIVQSYAGGKKLVNHLTVARRGEQNVPHAGVPDTSDSKLPPAAASPGNSALPSHDSSSSTSKPPLQPRR